MKAIIQFLSTLVTEGNAIRKTVSKTGVALSNPKPFVLAELQALATKQGFQAAHFTDPTVFDGKIQPPSVWVGIGKPDATPDELVEFLNTIHPS